ncbi:Receptor-like protein kinase THESEUS 1 [Apostasia shenzhenica]|uniref:Receptor-like protein kinase THESEUS 1 n=1 Tax=Apostasia shenzhenica TaxID=1088818 RepID=A0A2I0B249_9ASPA|nr:Receptor-like protein kinase THESEUS 1 [Apostasia shenzhenica]
MGWRKTHLALSLRHFLLLGAAAAAAFLPQDDFLLNCGGNFTLELDDGRTFQPDKEGSSSPPLFSPPSNNVVWAGSSDLYASARIFVEPTEYSFKIRQKGRHFLRLHFFPVNSSSFTLQSAVFSVAANGLTLLHYFSYSKLGSQHNALLKEYIVEAGLDVNSLVLTIVPSSGSVAFINAIEVISMPDLLFPSAASPVPQGPTVKISDNAAFQTCYRINVGGPLVSSKNDTLWRVWNTDLPFLINPASARNVSTDPNSIRHSPGVSSYTGPNLVYATAQEMADANVGNQKFNISWLFSVDSSFQYLVRLHFCDFVSNYPHNMLFNVYVNNQSALRSFELSNKIKDLSTAYVVDLIIDVSMDVEELLVQIGPTEVNNVPPNAILNGIEIMKLSDAHGRLDKCCGVSPLGSEAAERKKKALLVIMPSFGGLFLLGLIVAVFALHFYSKKKPVQRAFSWLSSPITPQTHMAFSDTKISAGSYVSSGTSHHLGRLLSFSEIKDATKNFDESLILGVGGFGKVYKGVLGNGLVVAVKRGNPRSQQGLIEFRTEIEMLSKLRHRHLVSLIGFCHEPDEMVLVYDFMAGGPLRRHLYGSDTPPLSWKQRLEICIGAAKGLHYLHTGAAEIIIHRDVKTTNILLDENLTAKVGDFGLSKMGPSLDQTHVTTAVKGSFGYLDPEYFRRQRLTEKSDVYSFGVVMLEVLCARPAINPALPREQINIVEWAMNWQRRGQLEQIIDPHLVGAVSIESLRKFGETAEKCLAEHGIERPGMGDVLWNLEYALQLQKSFTKATGDGNNTDAIKKIPELLPQVHAMEHDGLSAVSDGIDASNSRVFSQLMDPKGR